MVKIFFAYCTKKKIHSKSHLLQAILGIFWSILRYFFSISWEPFAFLWNFAHIFLKILWWLSETLWCCTLLEAILSFELVTFSVFFFYFFRKVQYVFKKFCKDILVITLAITWHLTFFWKAILRYFRPLFNSPCLEKP